MANTVIALLKDFPLVDSSSHEPSGSEATQAMAITTMQSTDTPTTGASKLHRLDPSSNSWTVVPFTADAGVGDAAVADELSATVDGDADVSGVHPTANSIMSMPDAVVFPLGVPSATGRAGLSTDEANEGQVNQPAFIFTNNVDPVMIFPRANGVLEYEPLTNTLGPSGNVCDFRCVSLETFADRVNFLNTVEGSGAVPVRHRNRLRWSARGTADPNPAAVGASSADLGNFAGHGVKAKKLGTVMALYFQDGVSLVSETGQAQAPYSFRNLDENRGLLSTHGLVSISKNEHFGVFNDGWWILDSSGRWQEVGVVSVNGQPVHKWKSFFYANFSNTVPHRLQLHYDEAHNWVRMCVPGQSNSAVVTEQWIYDIRSDRVWKDHYAGGLSCWGDLTVREDTSLIWSAATDTWDTIVGSWQSFEPSPGEQRLCHGNEAGFTYFHSDSLITRDDEEPTWSYETVPSNFGRELSLKTADRLSMEHVSAGNENAVSMAVTTGTGTTAGQTKSLNLGTLGNTVRTQSHHHVSDEKLGTLVSGTGEIKIRSLTLDYIEDQVERIASDL